MLALAVSEIAGKKLAGTRSFALKKSDKAKHHSGVNVLKLLRMLVGFNALAQRSGLEWLAVG